MNWIVEIPSGVANGPFNIKAVMELIKVGEVAPNSKLTHRHTNEIVTVTADEAIAGGAHVSRAEEDLEHNRATGEEELTAQLREAQSASERSAAQHDLVAAELEQMRLQSTDEREALTAKMKDFQSRQIQLQHENED